MQNFEMIIKALQDNDVQFIIIGGCAAIESKRVMNRPKDKETVLQLKVIKEKTGQ